MMYLFPQLENACACALYPTGYGTPESDRMEQEASHLEQRGLKMARSI